MTCKTCNWLDVRPDKAGRIVVRKDNAYACNVPLPDLTMVLPHSVTKSYGYNARKTYVCGDDGAGCPMWKRREKCGKEE